MKATTLPSKPLLLFDGECAVCRRIAGWVKRSADKKVCGASIIERPIGNDPGEIHSLNSSLNIWDAYSVIHILMPDGSMKEGGEAVAEVLRNLPNCRWFAWSFQVSIFGMRPFQGLLNLSYAVLSDVRPIFGCESCGTTSGWKKPVRKFAKWIQSLFSKPAKKTTNLHFSARTKTKAQVAHAKK